MGLGRDVISGRAGLVAELGITNEEIAALRITASEGPELLAGGVSVDPEKNIFFLGDREILMQRNLFSSQFFTVSFRPGRDFEPEVYGYVPQEHDNIYRSKNRLLTFLYATKDGLCVREDLCPPPPFLYFGVPAGGPFILRQGAGALRIDGPEIARYLRETPPEGFDSRELDRVLAAVDGVRLD